MKLQENLSWTIRSLTPEQEIQKKDLSQKLSLRPLTAHLLLQRNLTEEKEIRRFLHGSLQDLPSPFLLPDMDRAVERLVRALQNKERILLFGDYDVDGITGTAQLKAFFREMGHQTAAYLPHRLNDGYGLTEKAVRRILREKPDLLVTIDNGTNSRPEIAAIKERGIDVIVIDHHETPTAGNQPPAEALLNPKRSESRFGEINIASAGLVFLLLIAFRSRCREKGIGNLPNLKRYLDLACLGTIADVVPLTGTNRLIVRHGLEELASTSRPGLKALKEISQVRMPLGVGTVSFRLAPRINAAGRLADPTLALELLLTEDPAEASRLAVRLDDLNQERQKIVEKALGEALEIVESSQKDRDGIVVASNNWHLGVVGIVAAKLTEHFGRPAVVLALSEDGKEAKGSARTVPGFSVYEALKRIEGEMTRFGGHPAAAGMTLPSQNLERFAKRFDESVREAWNESCGPRIFIDASVDLSDVNAPLVKELGLLEPHGPGNPEPIFMSSSVRLQSPRIVGHRHFKTTLSQGGARIEAIGFDWASYLETALKSDFHSVAFSPQFNEWNGAENIQLKIKSMLPNS